MSEDTQSVTSNVEEVSLVDAIQSADATVTTVAEVATKKAKRNTNLATIVSTLANITDEELDNTRRSTIKALVKTANALKARFDTLDEADFSND